MISVVIPTIGRPEELARTRASLAPQLGPEDEVLVVDDPERRGPGWARNQGVAQARGAQLLFSDDDIVWQPTAVADLTRALAHASVQAFGWRTGYAYGGYRLTGAPRTVFAGPFCVSPWSYPKLRQTNIVPTMALVERAVFPGFDESLPMLEDWALWLALGRQQIGGTSLERVLFTTPYRPDGITYGRMAQCESVRARVWAEHRQQEQSQRGARDVVSPDSVASPDRVA